jgi:hypothetical protein
MHPTPVKVRWMRWPATSFGRNGRSERRAGRRRPKTRFSLRHWAPDRRPDTRMDMIARPIGLITALFIHRRPPSPPNVRVRSPSRRKRGTRAVRCTAATCHRRICSQCNCSRREECLDSVGRSDVLTAGSLGRSWLHYYSACDRSRERGFAGLQTHGFIATGIPEPASLMLLGSGSSMSVSESGSGELSHYFSEGEVDPRLVRSDWMYDELRPGYPPHMMPVNNDRAGLSFDVALALRTNVHDQPMPLTP